MSEQTIPYSHLITRQALPQSRTDRVRIEAPDAERKAIAAALGLRSVDKLLIDTEISPIGDTVWRVKGAVAAAVIQTCVVTLAPVPARVDEPFERVFSQDASPDLPTDIDIDVEANDPPEPLGEGIDLGAVAVETLALGLDPYPRAPGATFEAVAAAPPGVTPMTAEAAKPFAGLASLKKSMQGDK